MKIVTREASLRIARYAFEYAKAEKRGKVTAIHKANIQYVRVKGVVTIKVSTNPYNRKLTDGLFLECCREIAKEYPAIEFSDMIIDNCCMQVSNEHTHALHAHTSFHKQQLQ